MERSPLDSSMASVQPDTGTPGRGLAGRRAWRIGVGIIVAGSLLLRLAGLGWGIPNTDPATLPASPYRHSYHLDEDKYLWSLANLRPAEGYWDIRDYHWGTLQFYLIYGALEIGQAVGLLPAPWSAAFVDGNAEALPRIYMVGRAVSVAAGTLATLIVLALGRLLGGRGAGLLGGAAYALAPLAVVEADYLTNDVTMSALVAAGVLAATLAVRRGQGAGLVGAGGLLGVAIAAKYSAAFALAALPIAQWAVWRARSPGRAGATMAGAVLPWAAMLGGFVLGEPYVLVAPDKVRQGFEMVVDANGTAGSSLRQMLGMLRWQALNLGGLGLTWPLTVLAGGGLLVLLWTGGRALRADGTSRPAARPDRLAALILPAAVAGLIIGLAINRVFMLRYTQPLIPLLAVAAGVGWAALPRPGWRIGAGALALGVAGWITLGQVSLLTGPHPANALRAWLDANLQPGQQVARLWPLYPALDAERYRLVRLDPWRADLPPDLQPDYIILDDMPLGPPTERLIRRVAQEYQPVARFTARPQIGPFAWDEGTTPHDWKYSHPTFTVYARR